MLLQIIVGRDEQFIVSSKVQQWYESERKKLNQGIRRDFLAHDRESMFSVNQFHAKPTEEKIKKASPTKDDKMKATRLFFVIGNTIDVQMPESNYHAGKIMNRAPMPLNDSPKLQALNTYISRLLTPVWKEYISFFYDCLNINA